MTGRPAAEERQTVVIPVRLTLSEAADLDSIASEGGLGRGECIRSMLKAIFDDDKRAHGRAA